MQLLYANLNAFPRKRDYMQFVVFVNKVKSKALLIFSLFNC